MVIGVSARGCDARRVAATLLTRVVADAEVVLLLFDDEIEPELFVLAFELFFFAQLRITVGLITGSGSSG